jgi:hypothetical protein
MNCIIILQLFNMLFPIPIPTPAAAAADTPHRELIVKPLSDILKHILGYKEPKEEEFKV